MMRFIIPSLILAISSSAFAGIVASKGANPGGGGLQHSDYFEQERRRQQEEINRRNREARDRERALAADLERQRIAKEAREAKVRQDRIDAENKRLADERQRALDEANQKTQDAIKRRKDIAEQRKNGTLNVQSVTIDEMVDMFANEQDPLAKEQWATMIILLAQPNTKPVIDATLFLIHDRGWTQEQVDGLNPTQI